MSMHEFIYTTLVNESAEAIKGYQIPRNLSYKDIVNYCVGAENWTWVICKSSKLLTTKDFSSPIIRTS